MTGPPETVAQPTGPTTAPLSPDGLLLDLDGVVWIDGQVLPGVAETLEELRSRDLPVLFLTNDPRGSREQYADRLTAGGIPATAEQVLTSARAAAQLVAAREGVGSAVLVLGSPALHLEARAAGLQLADPERPCTARAVLIGGHESFDYGQLAAATLAAHHGARLYATSREPTFPGRDGPRPATGAILAAAEAAAGQTAVVAGKPEPGMFTAARQLLPACHQLVMVGDRLDTDIAGAQHAGIPAVLVLTGSTSPEDLPDAAVHPDLVMPSLADLRHLGVQADAAHDNLNSRATALAGDPHHLLPLHKSAQRLLTDWQAPDREQDRIRRFMLDFLTDHPDGASRSCPAGHLVASAVVLNPAGTQVLLVKSITQGLWTELGGHLELEDLTVADAALREAIEESGIPDLHLEPNLIDVEVFADDCPLGHPSRHLDLRFKATAPDVNQPILSTESLELAWFDTTDLPAPLGLAVRRSIHRALRAYAR